MDDKKIGEFIKELREERGMTQGELAEQVFVSRTVEGRWELGKISVTSQNLWALSKVLDISVDELISGKRKDKDLSKDITNVALNTIDKNARLKKLLKYSLLSVLFIALIFFAYFFYTFYNSVQVYKIYFDSNKYLAEYGLITKTRDKVYFNLDVDYAIEDKESIEELHLYYEDDSKVRTIKKMTNIQPFVFVDYLGYEEYISFKDFSKILDNLYLEVKYKDENVDRVKVLTKKDYANNKAFLNKDKSSIKRNEVASDNGNETETLRYFDELKELARSNYDRNYIEYNFNESTYEIYIGVDYVDICFIENSIKNNFRYVKNQSEFFSSNYYDGDLLKEKYRINLLSNECVNGDCKDMKKDYEKFLGVIKSLIHD